MTLWLIAILLAAPGTESARAHRDKALALIAQGKEEGAVKELEQAVAGNPGDAMARHELGKLLFKHGKAGEAIAQFDATVKLEPSNATAWYNLAYANRKAKRFEPAADAYQRYSTLAPDDPDAYFGLAESLREAGRSAEAVAAYRMYLAKEKRPAEQKWVDKAKARIAALSGGAPAPEVAPAPPPAPANIQDKLAAGDALVSSKDYRGALFAYQDAVIADPKNLEALTKVAQVYANLGHDDEAIDYWKSALVIDPQSRVAREGLAAAHERRTSRTAAPKASAQPSLVTTPPAGAGSALDHYTTGVTLVRERKYAEALAELDKSLAANPALTVALVARGSARIGLGKFNEAIADYTAAQKADPALAAPLFGLAEAYRALGQNARAIELYRAFAASNAPDAQESLKQYALRNAEALASRP